MPTENYDWKLGLDYDDVVRGLDAIDKSGNDILALFKDVGKDIGKAFDRVVLGTKPVIQSFDKLLGKADSLLDAVVGDIDRINKAMRQTNMSEWEKMADNYAEKIVKTQEEIKRLNSLTKDVNMTYGERLKLADRIRASEEALTRLKSDQAKNVAAVRAAEEQAKALKESEQSARTFTAQIEKIDKVFNAVESDVKNIDKILRQGGMKEWEKLSDDYAHNIKEAKEEVKRLQKESEEVNVTLEQRLAIMKKIESAQKQVTDLESRQKSHVSMKRQAEEAEEFRQKAGQIKGALQDVSLVAGAVGIALSAGIKEAFTTYSDFQAQLNTFNAMSGATEAQLKSFEQTVLALGGSTRYTAQEVAATGVELVKMGVPVDQVEGALRGLVDAADASGEGMQSTARVVVGAMNAWGLSGEEAAQQVGDIMVKAANEAQTSVSGMGDAAKYAASAFAAAGQPIEDMAGLLVLANKAGIQMTQAGNGLQNMMLRLQKPTAAGVDILKKYRIEIQRADGSMRNVIDILGDMRKNLEGLSGPAKAGIFKDLFGEVSTNTMQAIFNTSEKGFNEMIESMRNAGGTSEETAKKIRQGPQQAILEMASAFERAKIEFSKTLEPVFTAIIKGVTGVINWFNNLPEGVQTTIAALTTIGAVLGVVAGSLAGLTLLFGPMKTWWPLFTGMIASAGNSLIAFATVTIPAVIGAIGSFLVAAAPFLALAGALYFAWQTNLGGIRDLVEPMLESIGTWFEKTFIWIKGEFNKFLIYAGDMWDNLVNMFYTGVGLLDVVLKGFLDAVGEIFSLIAMVFTGNFKGAWDAITVMTANGSNALLKTFGSLFDKLKALFGTAWRGLSEIAAGAWDSITNPTDMSGGIARMKAGLNTVMTAIAQTGKVATEAFNDGIDAAIKKMSQINIAGKKMVTNAFAADGTKAPKKKQDPKINLGYAPQSAFAGTGSVLEDAEGRKKKQKKDTTGDSARKLIESSKSLANSNLTTAKTFLESAEATKKFTEQLKTAGGEVSQGWMTWPGGARVPKWMGDVIKSGRQALDADAFYHSLRDRGKRVHRSFDLHAAPGSAVYAPMSGKVLQAQGGRGDYLANVIIQHIDGTIMKYLHNAPSVKQGQQVQKGQQIATVNDISRFGAGRSHTHMRILKSISGIMDPQKYQFKGGGSPTKEDIDKLRSKELNKAELKELEGHYERIYSGLLKAREGTEGWKLLNTELLKVKKDLEKKNVDLVKIERKIAEEHEKNVRKQIDEDIKGYETKVKNINNAILKTSNEISKSIESVQNEIEKQNLTPWEEHLYKTHSILAQMSLQIIDLSDKKTELAEAMKIYKDSLPTEATEEQKNKLESMGVEVENLTSQITKLTNKQDAFANSSAALADKFRAEAVKEGIKSIVNSEEALNDYNNALNGITKDGLLNFDTAMQEFFDTYFKGVTLTEEESQKLEEALGFAQFQKDVEEAAKKAEYLQESIYNVAKSFTSIISAAGEAGAAIGGFIDFAIGGVESIMEGMKNGGPAGGIVAGVGVAIQGAAALVSSHFERIEAQSAYTAEREEERIREVEDIEIRALERRIEARREYGQSVLDIENQIIDIELKAKKREITENKLARQREILRNFSGPALLQAIQQTEVDAAKEITDAEQQAGSQKSDARSRNDELIAEIQREADRRLFEDRANIAKIGNDKLAQIEADAALERYNILSEWGQLINEALARGEDISTLEGQRNNALAVFDKNTAEQRKEIVKQQNIDELNAQFDHQEHLLNMKADGHAKTLDLMRLERDRQAAIWQEELALMDVNSQEYKDLTQKKADYIVEQNKRIQDSIEENNKAYKRELSDLRTNLEILKAQGTEDTLDDVVANNRKTLEDLIYEEQAAYDEMLANYGENQEMRTAIAETYAQRRANLEKAIFKEAAEAMLADYEAAERKKVDALIKPLQKLVDRDLKRIEAIDKQNEQYQRQIELIDEANEKLKERFEETDTTQWRSAIEGVDLEKALTEGISYIANEDVQGEVLDRSSRKNQLRGLTELLDKDERMAKASLDLEEIDKAAFNAEMTRIFTTRAAAIEATMAETENEEELADLKEELAKNYLDWKDLEISKIEETRSAERRQAEDAIRNNNRQKRSVQDLVDSNKTKIAEYETAHEEHMIAIREQFDTANQSAFTFGNLLGGLGAKFGSSATRITRDLTNLINKTRSAISLLDSYGGNSGNSVSKSSYTGGSWTATYETAKIPAYHDGGVFKTRNSSKEGLALLKNNEWVLNDVQGPKLDRFLTQAEKTNMMNNQSLTFYNTFNNEGDWQRFQSMMDQYARYDNKRLMRRMGQNAQSRVN